MSSKSSVTRPVLLCAAVIALLALGAATAAAITNTRSTQKAANWLGKRAVGKLSDYPGIKADSVDALYAAKRSGASVKQSTIDEFADSVEDDALDYATTAGATGKLLLAAVSSGRNPRCFGAPDEKVDLLALLDTFYNGKGRYGESSFDQGLAMLGLAAAGKKVPSKAVSFLYKRRAARGWGFGLEKGPGDDIDSTALIIEAMRAAGEEESDTRLKAALRWIRLQRNSDGGFHPGGSGQATQANTTAGAIRAARALGSRDRRALKELKTLQKSDGKFTSLKTGNSGTSPELATVDALIAVSGATRPVRKRSSAPQPCS